MGPATFYRELRLTRSLASVSHLSAGNAVDRGPQAGTGFLASPASRTRPGPNSAGLDPGPAEQWIPALRTIYRSTVLDDVEC